jgi:hypothetical protein
LIAGAIVETILPYRAGKNAGKMNLSAAQEALSKLQVKSNRTRARFCDILYTISTSSIGKIRRATAEDMYDYMVWKADMRELRLKARDGPQRRYLKAHEAVGDALSYAASMPENILLQTEHRERAAGHFRAAGNFARAGEEAELAAHCWESRKDLRRAIALLGDAFGYFTDAKKPDCARHCGVVKRGLHLELAQQIRKDANLLVCEANSFVQGGALSRAKMMGDYSGFGQPALKDFINRYGKALEKFAEANKIYEKYGEKEKGQMVSDIISSCQKHLDIAREALGLQPGSGKEQTNV